MSGLLFEYCSDRIAGVSTCYERVVITGTLPGPFYAVGMVSIPECLSHLYL